MVYSIKNIAPGVTEAVDEYNNAKAVYDAKAEVLVVEDNATGQTVTINLKKAGAFLESKVSNSSKNNE